jgi:hypothetical protein
MSSFTRTIQRTIGRDEDGNVIAVRRQLGGRGSKLGVVNPRDACRTKIKAKPKPWRSKSAAPPAKTKINLGAPAHNAVDRTAAHKAKMAMKAARRRAAYDQSGNIKFHDGFGRNRRTGKPHDGKREMARRVRQMEASNG